MWARGTQRGTLPPLHENLASEPLCRLRGAQTYTSVCLQQAHTTPISAP